MVSTKKVSRFFKISFSVICQMKDGEIPPYTGIIAWMLSLGLEENSVYLQALCKKITAGTLIPKYAKVHKYNIEGTQKIG